MDMLLLIMAPYERVREKNAGRIWEQEAQGPRHFSHGGDVEVSALFKEPVVIL